MKTEGVLLVGNYGPDQQESMVRFTRMLAEGLTAKGVRNQVIAPRAKWGRLLGKYHYGGLPKWLGYLDKYLCFPREMAKWRHGRWRVHVTDHSNAIYARRGCGDVVTCHDLLAVRGALGEDTDCPATRTGRILQKWILHGLGRAAVVACVSQATAADALRLLPAGTAVRVVPNGLNYPYGKQPAEEGARRRAGLGLKRDYVLHVGSNLRRKNKAAVLGAVAAAGEAFGGEVVFAGPPLTAEIRLAAAALGLGERLREVVKPDNATLEALYAGAQALVFPSRWEGFGWPIIEAQACGCPVVCGNGSALPEVAGAGAILCEADDHEALGRALLAAAAPGRREALIAAGRRNAARYSTGAMVEGYLAIYTELNEAHPS